MCVSAPRLPQSSNPLSTSEGGFRNAIEGTVKARHSGYDEAILTNEVEESTLYSFAYNEQRSGDGLLILVEYLNKMP